MAVEDYAKVLTPQQIANTYNELARRANKPDRWSVVNGEIVKVGEVVENEPYSISRDLLARMAAAHTSGMYNAIPEQEDFDNADAMIALLEKNLRN